MGGAAKTVKRPPQQPTHPQYANYWALLTRKRHIPPHSAQPRHTNHWAPRTQKRHQQEHRPQRPTECSDPTQHAKGRTGDCPGPRKGATTRRNVTQGGWHCDEGRCSPGVPIDVHSIGFVGGTMGNGWARGVCQSSACHRCTREVLLGASDSAGRAGPVPEPRGLRRRCLSKLHNGGSKSGAQGPATAPTVNPPTPGPVRRREGEGVVRRGVRRPWQSAGPRPPIGARGPRAQRGGGGAPPGHSFAGGPPPALCGPQPPIRCFAPPLGGQRGGGVWPIGTRGFLPPPPQPLWYGRRAAAKRGARRHCDQWTVSHTCPPPPPKADRRPLPETGLTTCSVAQMPLTSAIPGTVRVFLVLGPDAADAAKPFEISPFGDRDMAGVGWPPDGVPTAPARCTNAKSVGYFVPTWKGGMIVLRKPRSTVQRRHVSWGALCVASTWHCPLPNKCRRFWCNVNLQIWACVVCSAGMMPGLVPVFPESDLRHASQYPRHGAAQHHSEPARPTSGEFTCPLPLASRDSSASKPLGLSCPMPLARMRTAIPQHSHRVRGRGRGLDSVATSHALRLWWPLCGAEA